MSCRHNFRERRSKLQTRNHDKVRWILRKSNNQNHRRCASFSPPKSLERSQSNTQESFWQFKEETNSEWRRFVATTWTCWSNDQKNVWSRPALRKRENVQWIVTLKIISKLSKRKLQNLVQKCLFVILSHRSNKFLFCRKFLLHRFASRLFKKKRHKIPLKMFYFHILSTNF